MGNNRFGRNYLLTIQASDGSVLVIQPPVSIEFDITRNILTSANVCQVRIMNLNEHKRNLIMKDAVNLIGDVRYIELRAGYGNNILKVFGGNYTQAFSVREGNTWVTTIECFDGGAAFANATSSVSFGPNTPKVNIIKALINDLGQYGITPGVIGQVETTNTLRSTTYTGPTVKLLAELTKGKFFVDQGKANVLNDNECLAGTLLTINADTGLLGTPTLEQYIIHFEMVFEPSLVIGQLVQLQSSSISRFNGKYKIVSVKHTGTISEAVGGVARTIATVQYGIDPKQIGN